MPPSPVAALRAFNRFHSRLAGALDRSYLSSGLGLPEARVLYEVAAAPGSTAKDVRARTGMDQGHLSRLVARLHKAGLLRIEPAPTDARARQLHLTPSGRRAFARLTREADADAAQRLAGLDPDQRRRLTEHLGALRLLLGDTPGRPVVRTERRGDLGWVFARHAQRYGDEFGYHAVFDTYVAKGLAPYLEHHDPALDRLWIAELDGARVGSVAVHHVDDEPGWAKLRWFLVEKEARGLGLGTRLLRTALRFTKDAGYTGVFLWTVDDLAAASRLYTAAGFTLVQQTEGCAWAPWGHEQRWELRF